MRGPPKGVIICLNVNLLCFIVNTESESSFPETVLLLRVLLLLRFYLVCMCFDSILIFFIGDAESKQYVPVTALASFFHNWVHVTGQSLLHCIGSACGVPKPPGVWAMIWYWCQKTHKNGPKTVKKCHFFFWIMIISCYLVLV